MLVWPPTLPERMLLGFEWSPIDNRIEFVAEAGPSSKRPRDTTNPYAHAGTMLLTDAQMAALEAFHGTAAAGGSLEFEFPHPYTQVATVSEFRGGGYRATGSLPTATVVRLDLVLYVPVP